MQIHPATHNAAVDMPAMHYLGSSGQLERRRCSGRNGLPVPTQNNERERKASEQAKRGARVRYFQLVRSVCPLHNIRARWNPVAIAEAGVIDVRPRASAGRQSMIPKSGSRFSERVMLQRNI